MKNLNKFIKFRKQAQKHFPAQDFLDYVPNSDEKVKKEQKKSRKHEIIKQSQPAKPQKKKSNPEANHLIGKKDWEKQKYFSAKKLDIDMFESDNQELFMSSEKKKSQKIKLAMPKGFMDADIVQTLRSPLIKYLQANQPCLSIEEIFNLEIMKNVMGMIPEEQRSLQEKDYEQTQKKLVYDKIQLENCEKGQQGEQKELDQREKNHQDIIQANHFLGPLGEMKDSFSFVSQASPEVKKIPHSRFQNYPRNERNNGQIFGAMLDEYDSSQEDYNPQQRFTSSKNLKIEEDPYEHIEEEYAYQNNQEGYEPTNSGVFSSNKYQAELFYQNKNNFSGKKKSQISYQLQQRKFKPITNYEASTYDCHQKSQFNYEAPILFRSIVGSSQQTFEQGLQLNFYQNQEHLRAPVQREGKRIIQNKKKKY